MGFMDKLKSAARAITGGGAKVQLEAFDPKKGAPFTVKVQAQIGDADLKVDKVYVIVQGMESIAVDVPMKQVQDGKTVEKTERVSRDTATHRKEFVIAEAQTLTANQEYTWEGTVEVPADALLTYKGVNATHEWKLLAGLSVTGNDPDSGWVIIEIT